MNIALLFNSDYPAFGGYYGPPIMQRILSTQVIQSTNRHMRVSIGDILTYGVYLHRQTTNPLDLIKLCERVYQPIKFDRLVKHRLNETHGKATVFCWMFQNMVPEIAETIHRKLISDPAYLGAMDVDYSDPVQLYFFRNSLQEVFRLNGNVCNIFYEMGYNEDPDVVLKEIFEKNGFRVEFEDIGARRTIFDNYDSLDHFRRVGDFKRVFSKIQGLDENRASDLALTLEELHPRLFDVLASASRTLERAETEEDWAQVALSGRRFLEQTADYLFPPKNGYWKGREVGQRQYKNRLWAYIDQVFEEDEIIDSKELPILGKEADRLVDLFNKGLHSRLDRSEIEESFRDLVLWLTKMINLSPNRVKLPYLAYEDDIVRFINSVNLSDSSQQDLNDQD